MVSNTKKLADHYMYSKEFYLDVISLVPLDWLQINLGANPMLRFLRFLKMYRLCDYYYMVESRIAYPNVWRVLNLVHNLLLLAHWFACFYYLLSEAEGFQGDWVYPYRPGEYATLSRKYLGSLYWATLTLTTIGDLPAPETNADKSSTDGLQPKPRRGRKSRLLLFTSNTGYIFTIVSYMIGVFVFATIEGQVGNVITNRNANRLQFERLLDGAKTYMRHYKIPDCMKRRVLRWYDYSYSRGHIQGGGDINTALSLLPDKLKTELALHVNLNVLKKVSMFNECQPEFLHDLVLKMKAYVFTPGDLVCRKGEIAREMFIIADGVLEVKSETGYILTTLKAGDFFGEIGILNLDGLNKRTADVQSVGYSELFTLSRENILAAMKDYPEAEELLHTLGRKRLNEARNIKRAQKRAATSESRKQSIMPPISPKMFDNTTKKSIVETIRSDVKGLKNVLQKSQKGTRSENESLELQPLTNAASQQEERPTSSRVVFHRMPDVWSDESEDESSSSETKIGAGLPLLQRLKLFKEKQDNEAAAASSTTESKKQSVFSTAESTSPKEEPELPQQNSSSSSLPLLKRIIQLKQKENKETAAIQTTANMTAQVLASTVETQHRSPPLSITRQSTNGKEDYSSDESIPKSCISKLASQKKGKDKTPEKNGSVSEKDIESSSTQSAERKLSLKTSHSSDLHVKQPDVKKPIVLSRTKDTEEKQGETLQPRALLKDSSCIKSASVSVDTIKPKETVSSHITHVDSSIVSMTSHNNAPVPTQSVCVSQTGSTVSTSDSVCSITKQSDGENAIVLPSERETLSVESSTLAQDKMNAQNRLIMEDINLGQGSNTSSSSHKSLLLKFDSCKDKKKQPMDLYRVSSLRTRPPLVRFQNESKIYKSVDDLSPEYSGLPFVKKLKILNEKQKMAQLETNVFLRSSSLDSGGRIYCDDYNPSFDATSLTRSHSEAIAIEVVLHNQMLAERLALQSGVNELDDSIQQQSADSESALLSPESNETAERRNLKSILKTLSPGSLKPTKTNDIPDQASLPVTSVTSRTVTTSVDLRKLMRAQNIEGYIARHSKLSKSVTFNHDTLQSPPPSASSNVLTEGDIFFPINKSSIEVEEKLASRLCLSSDSNKVRDSHTNHVLGSSNGMVLPGNFNTVPTSPDLIPLTDSLNQLTNINKQVTGSSIWPSELTSTTVKTPSSKQVSVQPKKIELTKKQLQKTYIERPKAKQKHFFRPGSILLPTHASQEEEYDSGVLEIKDIVNYHMGEIQSNFQSRFHALKMEVKKRDKIISQLQGYIRKIKHQAQMKKESSECDEISDSPFMRSDSVDTVLISPYLSNRSSRSWPRDRTSWEDHSEEENLELTDLPVSITTQSVWNSTIIDIASDTSSSCSTSEVDDVFEHHNQNWEIQMLATELEKRKKVNNQQQIVDLSNRREQTCVRRRTVSCQ